jgi:hypothetical protein
MGLGDTMYGWSSSIEDGGLIFGGATSIGVVDCVEKKGLNCGVGGS